MKRNARLMLLIMLALFLMPVLAYATPLESFAENPIPYWLNGSGESVNVTHDSVTATVLVSSGYKENFDAMGDYAELGMNAPDAASIDAGWIILAAENDGNDNDIDAVLSDSPSVSNASSSYLEISYTLNHTTFDKIRIVIYSQNGQGGDVQQFTPYKVASGIQSWLITLDVVECILIYIQTDIGDSPIEWAIDYVTIGNSTLSLAVPLEPDTTQSIELMGNFSALESTVRFNITPSLFCDVNSTQVTFPDSTYAEFNDFARINFTLDEERIIFKIYVYALNMTLINSYSSVVGPANNDYLFMTDSEFEGSYTLLYLQGDIGYLEEVIDTENIFYLLFLSLEMWGYLGPIALVVIGYFLVEKSVALGVLWFIVECLFVANYLDLVGATPDYWWHIMILLLGGLFTCIYPLIDRK